MKQLNSTNYVEQRYIPEGYELAFDNPELQIQVYYKEEPVAALCFLGKSRKPAWRYRFNSAQARNDYVFKTAQSQQERLDYKKARQAQKQEALAKHGVVVGDIFQSSWGYEQTNVDYYQVVAVAGVTVTVRKIGAIEVEQTGWLQGRCVPNPDKFIGEPFKKRIGKYSVNSVAHITINSFSSAYKLEYQVVDGKKVYPDTHHSSYY